MVNKEGKMIFILLLGIMSVMVLYPCLMMASIEEDKAINMLRKNNKKNNKI
jgi:hypothetical protein